MYSVVPSVTSYLTTVLRNVCDVVLYKVLRINEQLF